MRKTLLASAAAIGLALAVPALAQTGTDTDTTPGGNTMTTPPQSEMQPHGTGGMTDQGGMSGHTGMSEPTSKRASNIEPGGTRATVAPRLPVPDVGENATPEQYLQAAQRALKQRRGGMAQESLERAQTRLLDRATAPSQANEPDTAPAIRLISQAREALGRRDWQGAMQYVEEALRSPRVAQSGGAGMGGGMNDTTGGGMGGAGMGGTGTVGSGGAGSTMPMPATPSPQQPASGGGY